VLLVEEALIDHLERGHHGHDPGERKEQSRHDWHDGVRRRIAEPGLDDVGAAAVETEVAAQVVVDSRIRQRTQNDDERKHRPQKLGTEDRRPIEEVERLQLRDDVPDP